MKRILAAYDTSSAAEHAVEFALDLAKKFGAEIIILSVARPPEPAELVETQAVLENAEDFYKEHFDRLKEKASAAGVSPRFEIKVGHPAEQIVHAAHEEKADIIVMGHRGKSRVERWLLGSISKRVLSYACCTVCVVR